jgi:hypothetical protein
VVKGDDTLGIGWNLVAQPPSAVGVGKEELKIRKYDYRRNLPHIERSGRIHFITFDSHLRWELPPQARNLALKHCLHGRGTKMQLYIALVMPDHVHPDLYAAGRRKT